MRYITHSVRACVRACACVCVRACVRACVYLCACVGACMRACERLQIQNYRSMKNKSNDLYLYLLEIKAEFFE